MAEPAPGFWAKLLDLIERLLPGMLLSLGVGYEAGARKAQALQIELDKANLILKEAQNNAQVDADNRSKSDMDIVLDATKSVSNTTH